LFSSWTNGNVFAKETALDLNWLFTNYWISIGAITKSNIIIRSPPPNGFAKRQRTSGGAAVCLEMVLCAQNANTIIKSLVHGLVHNMF
jgi:hypothetical protein